jgi:ABC-2 type transport system ATP-binding protein
MSEDLAVEVSGLEKSFGPVAVLAGIGLNVAHGSVFSLLGPNGAGKTTTVRILTTLTRADRGTARVAGYDVVRDRRQVRRSISLAGQYAAVDDLQTGAENLRMMARLSGLPGAQAGRRAAELLEQFGLAEAAGRKAGTYSGGMRRRLDLAASLVGRPSVVFLDEPSTGLDLRSRQLMWQVISDLAGSGTTVFLTTQYLEEADRLADRVAVIDGGRVVAEGPPAQLKQRVAEQRLDLVAAGGAGFDALVRAAGARAVGRDQASLTVSVPTDGTARQVRALLDELDPLGTAVRRFSVHTATLDDVFLALTGRPAQPEAVTPPVKETSHV